MLSKSDKKALRESLDHWYEILMMVQLNMLTGEGLYTDNCMNANSCALCRKYNNEKQSARRQKLNVALDRDEYCLGCPIKRDTGRELCQGTPFEMAYRAVNYNIGLTDVGILKVVGKEIDYLENLEEKLKNRRYCQ